MGGPLQWHGLPGRTPQGPDRAITDAHLARSREHLEITREQARAAATASKEASTAVAALIRSHLATQQLLANHRAAPILASCSEAEARFAACKASVARAQAAKEAAAQAAVAKTAADRAAADRVVANEVAVEMGLDDERLSSAGRRGTLVRVALSDYEPQDATSELAMRAGDRLLLFGAADENGWAEAAHITARELIVRYVPESFLGIAEADGWMRADFAGEGEGELSSAKAGDEIWQIDPHDTKDGGWVEVVTAHGERGCVPDNFVEWITPADLPTAAVAAPPAVAAAPGLHVQASHEAQRQIDIATGSAKGAVTGVASGMMALGRGMFGSPKREEMNTKATPTQRQQQQPHPWSSQPPLSLPVSMAPLSKMAAGAATTAVGATTGAASAAGRATTGAVTQAASAMVAATTTAAGALAMSTTAVGSAAVGAVAEAVHEADRAMEAAASPLLEAMMDAEEAFLAAVYDDAGGSWDDADPGGHDEHHVQYLDDQYERQKEAEAEASPWVFAALGRAESERKALAASAEQVQAIDAEEAAIKAIVEQEQHEQLLYEQRQLQQWMASAAAEEAESKLALEAKERSLVASPLPSGATMDQAAVAAVEIQRLIRGTLGRQESYYRLLEQGEMDLDGGYSSPRHITDSPS